MTHTVLKLFVPASRPHPNLDCHFPMEHEPVGSNPHLMIAMAFAGCAESVIFGTKPALCMIEEFLKRRWIPGAT